MKAMLTIVICACAAALAAPAPTSAPSGAMATAIREIVAAATPEAAMSAYSRGRDVDKANRDLHDTYMRKMLKMGRPDAAWHAAQILAPMELDYGLPQGVMAYVFAKQEEFGKAFAPGVRAAVLEPNNAPMAHNAGLLMAWYEHAAAKPAIAQSVKDAMKKLKSGAGGKSYAEAYERAQNAYKTPEQRKKEFEQKADALENEIQQTTQKITAQATSLKTKGASFDRESEEYQRNQRDLAKAELDMQTARTQQARTDAARRADRARNAMKQSDRDAAKLKQDAAKIQKELADLREKLTDKKAELSKTQAAAKTAMDNVTDQLQWQVPAVDGLTLGDSQAKPRKAGGGTTAASSPADSLDRRLAEAEAADKLSLAKIYLDGKMIDAARKALQEIVRDHAGTEAGKQAAELLKGLK